MAMPGYMVSANIVIPPNIMPWLKEYNGAVDPAFEGLLKIVTMPRMKPIIPAGKDNAGIFQPTPAPKKQSPSRMDVLLTAPSRVILSLEASVESLDVKFLVNAGFPDLPNVLRAECLDINILLII
jgi:hypothetical protein